MLVFQVGKEKKNQLISFIIWKKIGGIALLVDTGDIWVKRRAEINSCTA